MTPEDARPAVPRYKVSEIDGMLLPRPVEDGNWIRAAEHDAALAAGEARIKALEDEQRVPGAWVCNTCGFRLQKMVLRASDGAVGVDSRVVEDICPNDGTSMRALTWKEDAEASDCVGIEHMKRANKAEADLAALRAIVEQVTQNLSAVLAMIDLGWIADDSADMASWDRACQAYRDSLAYRDARAALRAALKPSEP